MLLNEQNRAKKFDTTTVIMVSYAQTTGVRKGSDPGHNQLQLTLPLQTPEPKVRVQVRTDSNSEPRPKVTTG